MSFDFSALLRSDLPPPAAGRFKGFPAYNFVGGHNDAEGVPVDALSDAIAAAVKRDGRNLANYGMQSGPQGYRPLREAIAGALERRAGLVCDADDILIVSGSLQALDLVYDAFIEPGDVVIAEAACYHGALDRLNRRGARTIGVEVDQDGMIPDALSEALDRLEQSSTRAKLIYTIPTVQNPTGSVMPAARRSALLELATRHGVAIFEDDCYADLVWDGDRPKAIKAHDGGECVVYCGSFSKTIAPALRLGYIVADWPLMRHILPLKTDGGTPALEQMALADFLPSKFDTHVDALTGRLKAKCDAITEAVNQHFGTAATFTAPKGGIFLWVELPDNVDTTRLADIALAEGVAINPGREWAVDAEANANRMRLCFGSPTVEQIREGVARLADICHREFGVPTRSANIER